MRETDFKMRSIEPREHARGKVGSDDRGQDWSVSSSATITRRSFLKALGIGTLALGVPALATRGRRRPNIVILLVDDMGYSDPGYMGGEAHTPNLDNLSEKGATFLNTFNNAKCAPSRAALMTGMCCQRIKAFRGAGNIAENNAACMAEVLGQNGYATIISGKWHIKPDPMDVGFQRRMGVNLAPYYFKPKPQPGQKMHPLYLEDEPIDFDLLPEDWYSTTAYTDYAIKAIDQSAISKNKPFFLYLAVNAPHAPLSAPKEDIDRYNKVYDDGLPAIRRRRYKRMIEKGIVDPTTWTLPDYEPNKDGSSFDWDGFSPKETHLFQRKLQITSAMIDRVDQELGKLISFLKDSGAWENTLLIFLSDNGATAEQGLYGGVELETISDADIDEMGTRAGRDGGTSGPVVATVQNTPLRKYKTTLWDGGMRTSMIVHWPNRIAPEVTRSYLREPIAIFDLAPTCYDAAGVDYPNNIGDRELQPMDGVSFLPLLRGEKIARRNLCCAYKDYRVVRNEKWKLLGLFKTKDPQKAGKGTWQLFDLARDQSETIDVADKHQEVVRELSQLWQTWDNDVGITAGYRNYWYDKAKKEEEQP